MAEATHLVAGASAAARDSSVYFPGEFSIVAGAFTLGQVLSFGSLAYIADYYGKLRPLHRTMSVSYEPTPKSGSWVPAHQIHHRSATTCQ
jgi:hypothetical protein